jgi:hypothetical protein
MLTAQLLPDDDDDDDDDNSPPPKQGQSTAEMKNAPS